MARFKSLRLCSSIPTRYLRFKPGQGIEPVMDMGFLEDPVHVALHGRRFNRELEPNVLDGAAFIEETEDLPLAKCETGG